MIVKEFKDLKIGDRVEYKDVYVHDNLTISGEGEVYGFSKAGFADWVWIALDNGERVSMAYENVRKI